MAWDTFMLVLRLFWRRLGLFLTANLIWLGLSLLIVPWPAATAGLFYLARRVIEEELTADPQPATLSDFWAGMRMYWLRSSILAAGDLGVLVIIAVALRFYGGSSVAPVNWLVGPITLIGLACLGAQLYLYPLLIQRTGRPLWALAREALLIAISYPVNTISLLLLCGVLAIAALILAGPILLVFFAFLALLQTVALRTILAQRGELALMLTPEQREVRERKR